MERGVGSDPGPRALPLRAILAEHDRALRAGRPWAHAAPIADRTISFGVGAEPGASRERRAAAVGFEVVRRATGGTGLVHLPGDLAWAIVVRREDPRIARGFVRAYDVLGQGVTRFLGDLGLAASWVEAPGGIPPYCTLNGRGYVLAVGERVVGGAAQHATAEALLHHGVVSVDLDRSVIRTVFEPTESSPLDRLAGLRQLGVTAPSLELAPALRRSLEATLGGPGPGA